MISLLGSLKTKVFAIANSIRLRSSASAYFSRTLGTATSTNIFTWSAWVKRGSLGTASTLFGASTNSSFGFNSSDQLNITLAGTSVATSTAVFRDPSAWYHIVFTCSGTNQTLYVNGKSVATATGTNTHFNTAIQHQIGAVNASSFFDGYLTEVYFIDGQSLSPASFNQVDFVTGVIKPKAFSGSFGANGAYLKFTDSSAATAAAIGKDSSGMGNNWTPNGVSVTTGVTYDSMIDVPINYFDNANGKGNYCVLNSLEIPSFMNIKDGGLFFQYTVANSQGMCKGTLMVSSGRWYAEFTPSIAACLCGVASPLASTSSYLGGTTGGVGYGGSDGGQWANGTFTAGKGSTYAGGNIIGIELDKDNNTVSFYKNGVFQFTYTGLDPFQPYTFATGLQNSFGNFNFGQRPFAYPPASGSGVLALNTQNLPDPSVVNPASVVAATLYSGTITGGASPTQVVSNAVNSVSFQPGLVWVKGRSNIVTGSYHQLRDSVRGVSAGALSTNATDTETTNATGGGISAFNSDGFSLSPGSAYNWGCQSPYLYIAWQWKAGASTVTNNIGTIISQVSANPSSGFSIVGYTGNGVSSFMGHGLGLPPSLIMIKARDAVSNWIVYHVSMTGSSYAVMNTTAAAVTSSTAWSNSDPSDIAFGVGTLAALNTNGTAYIAYCFAEIAGYSKFGKYTGNGNASGPFVYCGFKPKFLMVKCTSAIGDWVMISLPINTINVAQATELANTNGQEGSAMAVDILANGFKIRSATLNNTNAATYIFAAFADSPIKYAISQ